MSSSVKGKSRHAFNHSPLLRVFFNFDFFTQSLLFIILIFSFLAFFCSKPSFAQSLMNLEQSGIPPSMNPVGSGARALGMGGAFIAVADDATAASWNPGGLIQLETPEVSIVGSYFDSNEDLSFGFFLKTRYTVDITREYTEDIDIQYPFRGGISYAPRPAEGSPDDYYGFSIGTGIAKKRYAFDVGYQYRFGNDVGNLKVTDDFKFSQDVTEHTMFLEEDRWK